MRIRKRSRAKWASSIIIFLSMIVVTSNNACTSRRFSALTDQRSLNSSSLGSGSGLDTRELTLPGDMTAWGWMDVTKNGSAIHTVPSGTDSGCPDALPNKADPSSITQTTRALKCRFAAVGGNSLGFTNPAQIYFPPGIYYINETLEMQNDNFFKTSDSVVGFNTWLKGEIHVMGRDPATTQIVWSGSCAADPLATTFSKSRKFPNMIHTDAIGDLTIERLTLDGQNCAGTGIEMTSFLSSASPMRIDEMIFKNLTQVGIVGDRFALTQYESDPCYDFKAKGIQCTFPANQGMVSEVTIARNVFQNIGYGGIVIGTYNALDYWIRDNIFENCGVGITNSFSTRWEGVQNPLTLPWHDENGGTGGFDASNNIFRNSQSVDILVKPGRFAVRGNYSIGSKGQFIVTSHYGGTSLMLKGNTVISGAGISPMYTPGTDSTTLLQNYFSTSKGTPALQKWTGYNNFASNNPGAPAGLKMIGQDSFSKLISIGNTYTEANPFDQQPSSVVSGTVFQCSFTGLTMLMDQRTPCTITEGRTEWIHPFELLTLDDQYGVVKSTSEPILAPVRPIIDRAYVMVSLTRNSFANSATIQAAIDSLVRQEASCSVGDTNCMQRWGVVYLPVGYFPVGRTITIPGGSHIQIVGAGPGNFLYWNNPSITAPDSKFIFKIKAPAHVVLRDFSLQGEANPNEANNSGGAILAEVTDTIGSRVFTDNFHVADPVVIGGIGNVIFENRQFGMDSTAYYAGNGNINAPGYFAIFGGNPTNFVLSAGANYISQDTWYEGESSQFATCLDQANMTIESAEIAQGGWHGVTPDALTAFNVENCRGKTTILTSDISRDGFAGVAPSPSLRLPASTTSQTQVMLLQDTGDNNNFGDSNYSVPAAAAQDALTLDQGYVSAASNTGAQLLMMENTFQVNVTGFGSAYGIPAKPVGIADKNFIRAMLAQSLDPRIRASTIVPPIADNNATDIQIYNVVVMRTLQGVQFVTPGASARGF